PKHSLRNEELTRVVQAKIQTGEQFPVLVDQAVVDLCIMCPSNEVSMRPIGEWTALVGRVIEIIPLDIIKGIVEMSRSFRVSVQETKSCLAICVFYGIVFLFCVRCSIEVGLVCAVSAEDE